MFHSKAAWIGMLVAGAIWVGCGANQSGPSTGNRAETCQNSICPQGGGSYKFCTSPGASACRYVASDGTAFTCTSCSNCQAAVQMVTNWCASSAATTGATGGTTGAS